jgi:hypothetical protein
VFLASAEATWAGATVEAPRAWLGYANIDARADHLRSLHKSRVRREQMLLCGAPRIESGGCPPLSAKESFSHRADERFYVGAQMGQERSRARVSHQRSAAAIEMGQLWLALAR